MKKLKDLKGIEVLSKNEQKMIHGGKAPVCSEGSCPRSFVEDDELVWRCMPC